jgi:hypothetical protein
MIAISQPPAAKTLAAHLARWFRILLLRIIRILMLPLHLIELLALMDRLPVRRQ